MNNIKDKFRELLNNRNMKIIIPAIVLLVLLTGDVCTYAFSVDVVVCVSPEAVGAAGCATGATAAGAG